jgi:hypothetical protein
MRLSVNGVIQLLALFAHGLVQTKEGLPPKARFWASVMLASIQGAIGILSHFSNPDGTPADEPWEKK